MTFGEYITTANRHYLNSQGTLRQGQAYWNVMTINRPDLALLLPPALSERYLADLDPYYDDNNLPAFLDFLAEKW